MIRVGGPVDLGLTLQSGQVFHWDRIGRGWFGLVDRTPLYLEAQGDEVWTTTGSAPLAARYLALDHPLEAIHATFPDDPLLRRALAVCRGMRVIRQPVWECLATFITSPMKQVAHIRAMSLAIRDRFGERIDTPFGVRPAYPSAGRLARATETELRACGLGYRAPHLLATARRLAAEPELLVSWDALPTERLRQRLCELPGVGVKVANCVLLFAYGRLEAVPIDVWIGRILRTSYLRGNRRATLGRMARFAAGYFGPYAGYAQQILFHHARTSRVRRSTEGAS